MSEISKKSDTKIRREAKNRCGYCLLPQSLNPNLLEIEHLSATANGGSDAEENLWLACRLCNGYKRAQTEAVDPKTKRRVLLFNPRAQDWRAHFAWQGERIIGQTACGRATVQALKLNNELMLRRMPGARASLRAGERLQA